MANALSDTQVAELRRQLRERHKVLVEEIRQEMLRSDEAHFIDLAGKVHDSGEESVAFLLADIDLAMIDAHVEEVRNIEDALQRIAMGNYGICDACEGDIDPDRLYVYPMARRCLDCQAAYEKTHLIRTGPSL